MRPLLLLGDISGFLIVLGFGVLASGGLIVFLGIRLERSSPRSMESKVKGSLALVFGTVVMLSALYFFYAMWDDQPSRVAQRQKEDMEEEREAAFHDLVQDSTWMVRNRKTTHERDSAW
jgi:hypothetical protein